MIWKVTVPLGFILKYSQVQNWFVLETMLDDHKKYKKDAFYQGGRLRFGICLGYNRGTQIINN